MRVGMLEPTNRCFIAPQLSIRLQSSPASEFLRSRLNNHQPLTKTFFWSRHIFGSRGKMVQYRPPKRPRVLEQYSVSTLGKPGCPADFDGPFRSNIKSFLHDFARGPVSATTAVSLPGVRAWTLPLSSEAGIMLSMYILEETPSLSAVPHCDRCRVIGWAHHPVCRTRYHFIIGSAELEESTGVGKGRKLCLGCNLVIPASTKICPGCGSDATKSKVLEARTHLLHGVIHANGYGHLLRVNGREGGSQILSGREIMDLWDRLCIMLRARKISVMDVSKKYNLELRLLHALAYGHSWYGRWGYIFGRGPFNISRDQYTNAIKAISSNPLKRLMLSSDKIISQILVLYQGLSKPSQLNSVGQLINIMMELSSKLRRCTPTSNAEGQDIARLKDKVSKPTSFGACRWPPKRLEQAQQALLRVLRGHLDSTWLSRQALRESARSYIGDTGLLDFVLKSFVDKNVGQAIVRRRINQNTRMLEYRLEEERYADDGLQPEQAVEPCVPVTALEKPHFNEVVQHLALVYDAVLNTMSKDVQILLDVKHLVKDYRGEILLSPCAKGVPEEPLRCLCYVKQEGSDETAILPPELVVLPRNATIDDLKHCAEKAFQDVYFSFEEFKVVYISTPEVNRRLSGISSFFSYPTCEVEVYGTGIDECSPTRREAGTEDWVVNCRCGTKDDDGERMAECGICKVWNHTRCAEIKDTEPVPHQFLCYACCSLAQDSSHVASDAHCLVKDRQTFYPSG